MPSFIVFWKFIPFSTKRYITPAFKLKNIIRKKSVKGVQKGLMKMYYTKLLK